MKVFENISLKKMNTFGIEAKAKNFLVIEKEEDFFYIHKNIQQLSKPLFILGGGSNVLFSGDFEGTIIKMECKGIKLINETEDNYFVEAKAGEEWDNFVEYSLKNNWYGLENLSLIPGTVGASPVQNIGSYGAEVKDFIESVIAFDIEKGKFLEINNKNCEFDYRNSRFKKDWYGKYIIFSVKFKLLKKPQINISYEPLKKELETMMVLNPEPLHIREAVIKIRKTKLPDPAVLGNAGSFFKNPIVSLDLLEKNKNQYSDIVYFPYDDKTVKLSAGWLIEKAGWKGKRKGRVGVHEKQALVIVNYGDATAKEIIELAKEIIESVKNNFGVEIEPEVRIQ